MRSLKQLTLTQGLDGGAARMRTLVQWFDAASLSDLFTRYDAAHSALSKFTFADDISTENRNRLIARHWIALIRVSGCDNLSDTEKQSLRGAYGRAIHHTTLVDPDANARATVGGSQVMVNFGLLFPQGDEEISQTLVHEMMHCAGFRHPDRRDPPPGRSCAAPDPAVFDCPDDNGPYYGTAPLRAELCIAGDQSDVRTLRVTRKTGAESCVIDDQGTATIRSTVRP